MSHVNTQLDILINSLNKKISYLEDILKRTKEQSSLLDKDELDLRVFNNIMNNKQNRIDKIFEIDNGFQEMFNKVKGYLNTNGELYKEQIKLMKEYILKIGELGVEIKVLESKNKTKFQLITNGKKSKVKEYRNNKNVVSNYHSNINNQNNATQSHFFDSKK